MLSWGVRAGKPVTLVALGGSITSGQGVTVLNDTYVGRLFSWVQVQLPAVTFLPGKFYLAPSF